MTKRGHPLNLCQSLLLARPELFAHLADDTLRRLHPPDLLDRIIVQLEREYRRGGKKWIALLAIETSGRHGVPAPAWASNVLSDGLRSLEKLEVSTWEEAFGPSPFGEGMRVSTARRHEKLQMPVVRRICDVLATGSVKIDQALFELVAREFKIGPTLSARLYYEGRYRLVRRWLSVTEAYGSNELDLLILRSHADEVIEIITRAPSRFRKNRKNREITSAAVPAIDRLPRTDTAPDAVRVIPFPHRRQPAHDRSAR